MASRFAIGKLVPVCLVVLAICALSSASAARRERRVTEDEDSGANQRLSSSQSSEYPDSKSTNFRNNEFTSSPRKKIAQRLMGGHVRVDARTEPPVASRRAENEDDDDEDDDGDDEATWDDGLILSSAGNGKEKKHNVRPDDDDEKKTLSQQVKEGKYGLIQNEIHPSRPKRPGVISYLSNPEVPRDNAKNLGGLDEDEIWLAENHVLVLRGGNFPDHEADARNGGDRQEWPPIDDYRAPKRQVKIPARPKVPPPFPVQLSDDAPVGFIGVNGTTTTSNGDEATVDQRYDEGFLPGEGPFFARQRNATSAKEDLTSQENSTKKLDSVSGMTQDRKTKSGRVPPPPSGVVGPFYPALPPGAVFVVPPGNISDYDEDDQSIYYPPPYSFYYKQDNSTPVPPGPLVPGIILPPPPDFFSGQDDRKPTTKTQLDKYSKRPGTTPMPRITPTYGPSRKSTAKTRKATEVTAGQSTTKPTSRGSFTMKPVSRIKYKTTNTVGASSERVRAHQDVTSPYRAEVTTTTTTTTTPATSEEASTLEIVDFYTTRPDANRVNEKTTSRWSEVNRSTKRSKSRWSQNVSTRPVTLVTHYSSSTPSSVDEPVETTPASVNDVVGSTKPRSTPSRASYYFYEEDHSDDTVNATPNPTIYYRATTEASPYFRVPDVPEQSDQPRKDYNQAQRARPTEQTPKAFSIQVLEPVTKTPSRYRYTNSAQTNSASSRTQGQRMLADEAPVYRETASQRPQEPVRPYYTTERPGSFLGEPQDGNGYDYDRGLLTPKPIYQYSYEAADYFKRGQQQQQPQQQQQYYKPEGHQQSFYKPESQRQSYYKQDIEQTTSRPEPFDEWQDVREESDENSQYDYETAETPPEQRIQPQLRYENRPQVAYPSSTARPLVDVTPNPQHAYYTKADEQLLDDVTREYFTNFGKKLRGQSPPSTTPIYGKSGESVTQRPEYPEVEAYDSNDYDGAREAVTFQPPRVRVHYGDQQQQQQRPYSLQDDTRVNYQDPLPAVNPDSEWIPGFDPKQPRLDVPLQSYRNQQSELQNQDYAQQSLAGQRLTSIAGYGAGRRIVQRPPATNFVPLGDSREEARQQVYPSRPVSLAGDTAVNYRNPRPPVNPDAEYVDLGATRGDGGAERASYFAYRLPGDGGHFYFLTPQAIARRQQDEAGGYLYPRPRGPGLSRRRRRGPGNA